MKKSLLLIGLCLLFAVSCNQADKKAQQKEKEIPAAETNEPKVEIAVEDFIDLITQQNEAAAAQCGMKFIYEDEIASEDGDAGMYTVVFGKDVEKGTKDEEFGYALKFTSDHAYYFDVFEATSINLNLCFVNEADAKHMYEKLAQQEEIKGFSVDKQRNQLGDEYILLRAIDDEDVMIEIDQPECEDGVCRIEIYQYV